MSTTTPLEADVETGTALADSALAEFWLLALQRIGDVRFVADGPLRAAQRVVDAAVRPGRTAGEHLHLANAYSVALASIDPDVRAVFTDADGWLLPDGKPVMWTSALRRDQPRLHQVRGPQLMLDVADLGRAVGLKHYLLGGSEQVLADLQAELLRRFPGIDIAGTCSPPFRTPTDEELQRRDADIAASGAHIVWVGLGTPKQDFEAARLAARLPVVAAAVGAAFDYAAGSLRPAPHWVGAVGMEWAWRFACEPRRLWRRYTVGNAQFFRAVAGGELRAHREAAAVRARLREHAAVVVGQLPPPLHGSAVMTLRLVEALRSLGTPVSVVDRRFSRSVAEVGSVGLRKLLAIPSLLLRFARAAGGRGPLVVLVTTRPAVFLLDALLLTLARRPAVLYVHTVGFQALAARGRLWHLLVQRVLGDAARVVALGPSLVADLQPFLPLGAVSVIPNCTPDVEPQPHAAGAHVLFLSNLLPGKGADAFVRMAAHVQATRPDLNWRFDVAGAGDPASLPPLPDRTVVHGRVEGQAKERLLRTADLLVMPSTYAMEAQPLVIIEALSYGIPVVAYDNGGIADLVDASVGALVPKGDEQALQRAVLDLVGAPERLVAMREAARRRHRDRHSLPAYAEAWRSVLDLPDDAGDLQPFAKLRVVPPREPDRVGS